MLAKQWLSSGRYIIEDKTYRHISSNSNSHAVKLILTVRAVHCKLDVSKFASRLVMRLLEDI
jgi:hypothetical protein